MSDLRLLSTQALRPGAICVDDQTELVNDSHTIANHRQQALSLSADGVKIWGKRYKSREVKLRRQPIFYSLDGEEIAAYEIEVNTDGEVHPSTVATLDDTRMDLPGCLAPRYAYSDTLHEDVLEQYDLVTYQEPSGSTVTKVARHPNLQSHSTKTPQQAGILRSYDVDRAFPQNSQRKPIPVKRLSGKVDKVPSSPLCSAGVGSWWFSPTGVSESTMPTGNISRGIKKENSIVKSQCDRSNDSVSPLVKSGAIVSVNNLQRDDDDGDNLSSILSQTSGNSDSLLSESVDYSATVPGRSRFSSVALALREFAVTFVDDVLEGIKEREWFTDEDDKSDDETADCESLATGSTTLHELVYSQGAVKLVSSPPRRFFKNHCSS